MPTSTNYVSQDDFDALVARVTALEQDNATWSNVDSRVTAIEETENADILELKNSVSQVMSFFTKAQPAFGKLFDIMRHQFGMKIEVPEDNVQPSSELQSLAGSNQVKIGG